MRSEPAAGEQHPERENEPEERDHEAQAQRHTGRPQHEGGVRRHHTDEVKNEIARPARGGRSYRRSGGHEQEHRGTDPAPE